MITLEIPAEMTVEDLERLPDIGYRFELHGGNLVIMSPATMWHSWIGRRLANALSSAGRPAYQEVGIKLGQRENRTADVAIFVDEPDKARAFFEPSEILAAVEIVSPSSEDDDRVMKPLLYARAGISEYWRVEKEKDSDEAIIFQHKLAHTKDGTAAYVETDVTTLSALERAQG